MELILLIMMGFLSEKNDLSMKGLFPLYKKKNWALFDFDF